MITFNVDKVTNSKKQVSFNNDTKKVFQKIIGYGIEANSIANDKLQTLPNNNLIIAINTAYDCHLPLTLSPDMLWLTISQGLAQHVMNNAEELRHQFVNFEGKQKIIIDEPSFKKGSSSNNWQSTFGKFSDRIAEYIGKKRDLIVSNFSTTGPVEQAASEVVLMEAMSKYFDYGVMTCCGIPHINLLGTKEDWENIHQRVRNISEFNLSWWTDVLLPITQEFVNAANGNPNTTFWRNIYKESGGSGGPFISGWSTHLFPYIKEERNVFSKTGGMFGGLTTSDLPIGLSKVPFEWNYYGNMFNMELTAGFTGFIQEEDGTVVPQIGWSVRDKEAFVQIECSYKKPTDHIKKWQVSKEFAEKLEEQGVIISGGYYSDNILGMIEKEKINSLDIKGLTIKVNGS